MPMPVSEGDFYSASELRDMFPVCTNFHMTQLRRHARKDGSMKKSAVDEYAKRGFYTQDEIMKLLGLKNRNFEFVVDMAGSRKLEKEDEKEKDRFSRGPIDEIANYPDLVHFLSREANGKSFYGQLEYRLDQLKKFGLDEETISRVRTQANRSGRIPGYKVGRFLCNKGDWDSLAKLGYGDVELQLRAEEAGHRTLYKLD